MSLDRMDSGASRTPSTTCTVIPATRTKSDYVRLSSGPVEKSAGLCVPRPGSLRRPSQACSLDLSEASAANTPRRRMGRQRLSFRRCVDHSCMRQSRGRSALRTYCRASTCHGAWRRERPRRIARGSRAPIAARFPAADSNALTRARGHHSSACGDPRGGLPGLSAEPESHRAMAASRVATIARGVPRSLGGKVDKQWHVFSRRVQKHR